MTFTVGAVPVVLVPEIEIELDGLGEVDAAVATSVDASLTASAGARYEDGKLSPIAELDQSFDHQPPDPQGSAKLAATLSSELEVAAYGFGGPTFGFDAGLELNADIDATPWWTLDAPIAFTAGLDGRGGALDLGRRAGTRTGTGRRTDLRFRAEYAQRLGERQRPFNAPSAA